MKLQRWVISVAVAAVAAGVFWLSRPPEPTYPNTSMPIPGAAPDPALPGVAPPTDIAPPPEAPETTATPLWRVIDEASVDPLPEFPAHWSEDGRRLVSVSGTVAASRSWQVGERLTIPLPQLGETYEPVIAVIDEGPGGSRAAVARRTDRDGRSMRYVVTASSGNVFAWIETPEGSYELFADEQFGWLLPTASMTANMDFSRPDYIVSGGGVGEPPPATGSTEEDE